MRSFVPTWRERRGIGMLTASICGLTGLVEKGGLEPFRAFLRQYTQG